MVVGINEIVMKFSSSKYSFRQIQSNIDTGSSDLCTSPSRYVGLKVRRIKLNERYFDSYSIT